MIVVLGGTIRERGFLNSSANDIFETSAYNVYGNPRVDTPYAYGILITIRNNRTLSGYWCIQMFFYISNIFNMSYRTAKANVYEYEQWDTISVTQPMQYSTLESLANALKPYLD